MSAERRPSFAADFPRVAEVDELVGRVRTRRLRAGAPRRPAAAASPDPAVREAVRTLLERTRPDPLAVGLLAITGALLLLLTGYWVLHGHAPPGAAPPLPAVERVQDRPPQRAPASGRPN